MIAPRLEEPPRTPWWVMPLVVAVVVGGLVVYRAIVGSDGDVPASSARPSGSGPEAANPVASAAPRCQELAEPFVIGDPPARPAPAPSASASAGALPDEPEEEASDPTAPFAVEVGRGTVFEGGFAAGARRDEKQGGVGFVATLGPDGRDGKLVRLGKLRGDLDPPIVAGAGKAVVAVMVVPNAGGRTLKVAKVEGGEVTWGPELSESRDDSLAMDIAASPQRAVIVWDDLLGASKRSSVMLAAVDVAGVRLALPTRPISAESESAEHPRLISRPGGYWLSYVVRGSEKAKGKRSKSDDEEERELGEAIAPSWVQLVPLYESGAPAGAGRAVTPKGGHVLAYDLELGDDGGALVAWRDDDTPTGSTGGRLFSVLARLGGVGEARALAEETAGAGVPDLFPGWVSLASASGATRLAAMSPRGDLLEELAAERSLGAGVPIAATGEAILWARPAGKAMRLSVVRCKAQPKPAAAPADAGVVDGGG